MLNSFISILLLRTDGAQAFNIGNGTKQGGVLSRLFTRYVHDLIKRIAGCGNGCAFGNVFMNL